MLAGTRKGGNGRMRFCTLRKGVLRFIWESLHPFGWGGTKGELFGSGHLFLGQKGDSLISGFLSSESYYQWVLGTWAPQTGADRHKESWLQDSNSVTYYLVT